MMERNDYYPSLYVWSWVLISGRKTVVRGVHEFRKTIFETVLKKPTTASFYAIPNSWFAPNLQIKKVCMQCDEWKNIQNICCMSNIWIHFRPISCNHWHSTLSILQLPKTSYLTYNAGHNAYVAKFLAINYTAVYIPSENMGRNRSGHGTLNTQHRLLEVVVQCAVNSTRKCEGPLRQIRQRDSTYKSWGKAQHIHDEGSHGTPTG